MLKRLRLKNFKSWPEVDWELGAITALFGTNSSGKSSLLQSLLLLKQTRDADDRSLALDFGSERSLVQLGNFHDTVHRHELDRTIEWEIEWRADQPVRVADSTASTHIESRDLALSVEVAYVRDQAACRNIEYGLGSAKFGLKELPGSSGHELYSDAAGFAFRRSQGRPPKSMPGPSRSYAFPDLVRASYQNAEFLADLEVAYGNEMDRLYHLGPLRDYPRRDYEWSGSRLTDVGRRGEHVVAALLAAARDGVKLAPPGSNRRTRAFQQSIADWLKTLGLVHDFRVERIGESNLHRVWVRIDALAPEVLITDVGIGISQVLPALVLLHYVPEGSTVVLEQPEIHLHPIVQSGLADVIIYAASKRRVQIIVESHSEHLLRRLQRRMAEEQIDSQEAKLYFCRMAEGRSVLDRLQLTDTGHIRNWPKGFFGDEMSELAAMEEAALRRRIAAE